MDVAALYSFAWRYAGRFPEPVLRAACRVAADVTWLRRTDGVRRMEANYARVRPELTPREVRRLSREGMRRYLRYFREAFTLQRLTPAQIDARVRVEGEEHARAALADGRSAVLALGHTGNWDLAGAWATPHLAPVLTVAERLRPPELYEEFVAFRRSLGIDVLGLGDDGVFRALVRGAQGGGRLLPLLADRDLTAAGIEVDLCGRRARVAAGPAALAVAGDVDLVPTGIYHERLRGERRRRAGSAWGIVLRFHAPVPRAEGNRREQMATMTQAWVDTLGAFLVERTADWHMLQRVFVEDLDPGRYAATRAGAGEA
ncbi:phosphatidylinositol mannoside acyltransferase [Isoptericola dokdonensis]|uniref:Phosphatidylinositol mannoside acyltransferase n=1 Tax=Isoptericola dokdonensis DS-3 TaxID=1300344 RepID=A0A168EJP3_9MICO|nr:phosphatidylinositol mannoside acyltransferase [Isoptericola dokdonensis]ANC30107.1 Phosphatidylinositol mannoside acyltransferase [Isoptericola dokdonensis DS-3]